VRSCSPNLLVHLKDALLDAIVFALQIVHLIFSPPGVLSEACPAGGDLATDPLANVNQPTKLLLK
jgi:hypothetical protein